VESNPQKLIFWLLTFVAVVMTSIGGAAASHMVSQMDTLSLRLTAVEVRLAAQDDAKIETSRRLIRIEDKLDFIRDKQNLQTEK
jgi:hypothetical protein